MTRKAPKLGITGFPSPAQDFIELTIDLNKELIKHPLSTFFARAEGSSMVGRGIYDGDLLVIDKSLPPKDGGVFVCVVDGEFALRTLRIDKDCCWLMPANDQFKPIRVTEDNDFVIWGRVIHSITSVGNGRNNI